jgi:hypothetical protein
MSKSLRRFFTLIFLFTLVGAIHAQKLQAFSTMSIFANNKPTSKECQEERQTLISLVGEFPSPNIWTFFSFATTPPGITTSRVSLPMGEIRRSPRASFMA